MAEPWKKYAPASSGPWEKYAAPPPATPAPAPAETVAPREAEKPGFWSGVGQLIPNPVALIKEYINRPSEYGAALRGATAAMQEMRGAGTPETAAAVDEGMAANVQLPGSGVIPVGTEPLFMAGENVAEGNYAAAAGNLAGIPLAVGAARVIPPVARATARGAVKVVGKTADSALARDLVGVASPRTGRALDALAEIRRRNAANAAEIPAAPPAPHTAPVAAATEAGLTAHEQSLVKAAIDHPAVYRDLPAAVRARLIPELSARGFTEFGRGKKSAQQAAAPQPVTQPLSAAAPVPQVQRSAPVAATPAPKPVEVSAPVAAEASMEDLLQQSLDAVKTKKAGGISPQPVTIPATAPEFESGVYEASARGAKVSKISTILHEHGIPYADAKMMTPEMWAQAAKAAGVKVPSQTSIVQALFELRKLERPLKEVSRRARK